MRWRRGEIGLVIGGLLSTGLHNVQSSQTGCSVAMVTPPPRAAIGKGQEKVLRRENSPVEPYSLSLVVAESRSSIGEGGR